MRLFGGGIRSIADGVSAVSIYLIKLELLAFNALPFNALPFGLLNKEQHITQRKRGKKGVWFLCCCIILKLTTSGTETAGNEGAKAESLALGFTPLGLLGQTEARSHMPEVL